MKNIFKLSILAALMLVPAGLRAADNLVLSKTAKDNGDNTYTLTLETYTTGTKVSTSDIVPTDFVLVLDHSGSMSNNRVEGATVKGSNLNTNLTYYYNNKGSYNYIRYDSKNSTWRSSSTASDWKTSSSKYKPDTNTTYYKSRLAVTKEAVASFIRTVYSNNPARGDSHQISIVWYGSDIATSTYTNKYNLVPINSEKVCEDFANKIISEYPGYNETMGTSTYCENGLEQAYKILSANGVVDNEHNKVVLFFTDGEPGSSANQFQELSANKSLVHANNIKSSTLTNTITKDGKTYTYPSRLYTIGLMSSGTSGTHKDKNGTTVNNHNLDKYRFMHYVSSNYNIASPKTINDNFATKSYTFTSDAKAEDGNVCQDPAHKHAGSSDHHGSEDPHGYFRKSDGSDLDDIFTSIADENSNTNTTLTEETAIVMDALTNMFKLPEGTTVNDIDLFTCSVWTEAPEVGGFIWESQAHHQATGTRVFKDAANNVVSSLPEGGHEEWWVSWKPWNDNEYKTAIKKDDKGNEMTYPGTNIPRLKFDIDNDKDVDIDDFIRINSNCLVEFEGESDYLEVSGFDFVENFVGKNTLDNVFQSWRGKKLIIQFTIKTDPANTGGVTLNTNDPKSGVYVKGENGYTAVDNFISPKANLPYLRIFKKGLAAGQSAIFEVSGPQLTTTTVILSSKNGGNETPSAIVKLPAVGGEYTVKELPDWSWETPTVTVSSTENGTYTAYNATTGFKQTLTKPSDGWSSTNCYLDFYFKNSYSTSAVKHDETYVHNNLGTKEVTGHDITTTNNNN